MVRGVLGALAILMLAGAAPRPETKWRVVDVGWDFVLLVTEDVPGSGDVVPSGVLTVFANPQDGADSVFGYLTINCATDMMFDEGATRLLGTQPVGKRASLTPHGPEIVSPATPEHKIFEYVCIGPLANADLTPLPTTAAAIAHARRLLTR